MNLDKPLATATLADLYEVIRELLNDNKCNAVVDLQEKKYVYGIKGLVSLLGCSIATAERVKASGILNPAISQHGRTIIIDAEMALDILRISGKHKYILSKMRKEQ